MMPCRWTDRLDDVAAGGAPDDALARHLESCAECTAGLAQRRRLLARIDAVTREWMNAEPPADLLARVHARAPATAPQPLALRRISLGGIAVAAALVLAAYLSLHHTTEPVSLANWQSPTASLLQPTIGGLYGP